MTVIRPNSVSGITSITAQANEINFFRSNGTLAGLQLNGVNFNTTSGISTFAALKVTGNLDVEGVLTYQDVTNVDSVGIITARSTIDAQGDVSIADKIIHTGDTNTAIRFPAADTISFETNGAERLRIRSDGKVGIGTDMEGAPASNYGFGFYRATGTGYLYTETGQSGASAGLRAKAGTSDFTIFTTQGVGQLAVYDNTNSAERLRIASDGKITTNTTGTIIADYNSSNSGGAYFQYDIGANGANIGYIGAASHLTSGGQNTDFGIRASNNLDIAVGGSSRKVYIYNSGNIQLNTTGTLAVDFNSSNGAGAYFNFDIGANGANIGYLGAASHLVSGAATADLGIRSTQNFVISTGGATERFRIDTSGRLLIGKNSGDHKVDIDGSNDEIRLSKSNLSDYTGIQLDRDASGTAGGYFGLAGATNHYVNGAAQHDICVRSQSNLLFSTNGADERLRIASSGKIGMGLANTSPNGALDIRTTDDDDAIRLVNTSTGDNGIQWWNEYGGLTKRASMDYGEGDANFDIKCFRGDAQTDRPYGNVRIMTGSYSNPTTNFRVTTLGSVHSPNQPGFHVYNVSGTQSSVLTFSNSHHNIGNHMNLSNGRFTAPISGRYLFTFAFLHNTSPTSYARVLFQLNGSRNTNFGDTLCDDTGLYLNTSMSMIFNLSANDTVELYNEGNNIYGTQYGAFSGILLG